MIRISLALLLALAAAGCKKAVPPEAGPAVGGPVAERPAPRDVPPAVTAIARNFERVHFPYDSATLDESARAALRANAQLLRDNADVKVEVQGHCDERGTTDYNLALGEKRAAAVRKFLAAEGVAASRLKAISMGEERPLDPRATEVAWAQNRRAEFRITWAGDGVALAGTTD